MPIKIPWGIGEYPPGYNPKVHGAYSPARYYGKPDTPFTEVKLGDTLEYLKRRSYNPLDMTRAVGRAWWRYSLKWLQPKRASVAGPVQFLLGLSLFYYINQYPHLKYHRHTKYHW